MEVDPDLEVVHFPTPLDDLRRWFGAPRPYRLTRSLLLRFLGLVYLAAFFGLTRQVLPLIGSHGLMPAASYLADESHRGAGFWQLPTLFWVDCSDTTLTVCASLGVVLSFAVVA